MWVFTKDGFYSVVQKDCRPDEVLVRSRQRADLVKLSMKLGLKVKIREQAGTDYRYRTVIKKTDWARYAAEAALDINYPNFKDRVPKRDFRRHDAYLRCWEALFEWQESSRK
jgi:hypothetical protein